MKTLQPQVKGRISMRTFLLVTTVLAVVSAAQAKAEVPEEQKKQECIGDGFEWKKAPWPFSGNFCTRPAAYECGVGHNRIIIGDQVRRENVDALRQIELDVRMGRKIQKDNSWNEGLVAASREDELKDIQEYFAHGCTEDADKIREVMEVLK